MENEKFFECENIRISMPNEILKLHKYGYYFNDFPNKVIWNEKNKRIILRTLIDKKYLDINKNILDSGAFFGDQSLPLSKMIKGYVYAIDPSISNLNFINKIAKANNIKNIITYELGLSDKNEIIYTCGVIEHCVFQGSNKVNSYNPPHGMSHGNPNKSTGKIIATTIDNLYKEKKIENLSLIHLDIEGFEYPALKSSKETIKKDKPLIIWENHIDIVHNKTGNLEYKECCKLLGELNYSSYIINEVSGGNPACRNFISVSNDNKLKFEDAIKNIISKNIVKQIW